MQQRLEYLDSLKGCAIFLVIVGHVELSILKATTIITAIVSMIHIPVFMFISGYLLFKSLQNGKQLRCFFSDKLKRLILPFFSFVFIYSFIFQINIDKIFLSDYKYGYWFTLTLFLIILVVSFFSKLLRNKNNPIIEVLILVSFYILICYIHFFISFSSQYDKILSVSQFVYYYPIFVFGYLNSKYGDVSMFFLNSILSISFSLLIFLICLFLQWFMKYDSLLLLISSGVSGVVYLNYFFQKYSNKLLIGSFSRFGKLSLEIYMIHFFYITLFTRIVDFTFFPTYLVLLVMPVLLLFMSYYTGMILKKNKLLNILLWGKF